MSGDYRREWARANPKNIMLIDARKRAKAKGVPFDLTLDDFEIGEICPVLGLPMIRGTDTAPSLDRIVPELGYVPGNVLVISVRANRIKYNATPSELMALATFYSQLPPQ